MESIIKKNKYGVYNFQLFSVLNSLPDNKLFYSQHNSRHPIAEYNVSLKRINSAIRDLIDDLYLKKWDYRRIDLAYIEMLESIIAFIEVGYKIMKLLYPKSKGNDKIKFSDKWLEEINYNAINSYKFKISEYRKNTAIIVNEIKHNNGTCTYVNANTKYGVVLGFYLDSLDENGTLSPKREIHKDFNGVKTAISYSKEILSQIANIVFISNEIANTINRLYQEEHGYPLHINEVNEEDSNMYELIEVSQKVKMLFLPNEYNSYLPEIKIFNDQIKIKRPSTSKYYNNLLQPSSYKIGIQYTSDGVTKSFTLPYFLGK